MQMQLDATPCPGRSPMAATVGECRDCTRLDLLACDKEVPPTVYDRALGEHVCEGRRSVGHALNVVDLAQASKPNPREFAPVSVIRRGDAA